MGDGVFPSEQDTREWLGEGGSEGVWYEGGVESVRFWRPQKQAYPGYQLMVNQQDQLSVSCRWQQVHPHKADASRSLQHALVGLHGC